MANYNKKGDKMPKGRPFVPGDPRAGRPKNPPELKELQQMTKGEFSLLMHRLMHSKPEDLNTFNGTILEMTMASIVKEAIRHGDPHRLQFFIERLFGKVKDEIGGDIGFKIIIEDYKKNE